LKITSIFLVTLILLLPIAKVCAQSSILGFNQSKNANVVIDQTVGYLCKKCGKENGVSYLFCSSCGPPLKKSDAIKSPSNLSIRLQRNSSVKPTIGSDDSYYKGSMNGRFSASDNFSSGGWFAGGIATGVLLGLIGTGIIAGVSIIGSPEPPNYAMMCIQNNSSTY
jgi:hypothetical protein